MVDWRKVALSALLADGVVEEHQLKVLKKELWSDGAIEDDAVHFLIELRHAAKKKAKMKKVELMPAFERLFFKAMQESVVHDGKVSAKHASWLREKLFAAGKADDNEKAFLQKVKKSARTTSAEFNALFEECMAA
jgi:hypothetical protein